MIEGDGGEPTRTASSRRSSRCGSRSSTWPASSRPATPSSVRARARAPGRDARATCASAMSTARSTPSSPPTSGMTAGRDGGHVPDGRDRRLRRPLRDPEAPRRARPDLRRAGFLRDRLRRRPRRRRHRSRDLCRGAARPSIRSPVRSVLAAGRPRTEPGAGAATAACGFKARAAIAAANAHERLHPLKRSVCSSTRTPSRSRPRRRSRAGHGGPLRRRPRTPGRVPRLVRGGPAAQLHEATSRPSTSRRSGLHLTYHVNGDSRQRGLALLEIKTALPRGRVRPGGPELPDYLPVMLEFAALAPEPPGANCSREPPVHRADPRSLRAQESPWARLLDAICEDAAELGQATSCADPQARREGPAGRGGRARAVRPARGHARASAPASRPLRRAHAGGRSMSGESAPLRRPALRRDDHLRRRPHLALPHRPVRLDARSTQLLESRLLRSPA